ncbi:MAG: FecR domain-containing protein [Tannerella sp.]|nr:FecR domain-containing protein [Tannerella sp.]
MPETLLIRYLNGECSPSEIKEIERWVAADRTHADLLFEMERIWALKDERRFSDPQKTDEMFDRLWTGLRQRQSVALPVRKAIKWKSPFKYAAAAAIAALLSVNLYFLWKGQPDVYAENTVEVPGGQRVALTLSDGTRVWLNSQTTFTYPSRFSARSRNVRLRGEAFFEVAGNASKPFIVESPLLRVKVLGTKFDVKTYPHQNASVTLSEGKVEVSTGDGHYKVTLSPSQQAVYSETTGLTLRKNIDPDPYRSWTVGELNFHNQTLADIAADLERRFDVHIRIAGKELAEDRFTCHFTENATVEQILTGLKETKRLSYKIDGKDIAITGY